MCKLYILIIIIQKQVALKNVYTYIYTFPLAKYIFLFLLDVNFRACVQVSIENEKFNSIMHNLKSLNTNVE